MIGQSTAVVAGFFAASASSCAKLAMAEQETLLLCEKTLSCLAQLSHSPGDSLLSCDMIVLYVRMMFFALVFVCNAVMWTMFVKSLQLCSSSIQATVTNSASNFFFTALQGWLIFGEALNLLWWFGASLVVLGLLLIHRGSTGTSVTQDKEKVS